MFHLFTETQANLHSAGIVCVLHQLENEGFVTDEGVGCQHQISVR